MNINVQCMRHHVFTHPCVSYLLACTPACIRSVSCSVAVSAELSSSSLWLLLDRPNREISSCCWCETGSRTIYRSCVCVCMRESMHASSVLHLHCSSAKGCVSNRRCSSRLSALNLTHVQYFTNSADILRPWVNPSQFITPQTERYMQTHTRTCFFEHLIPPLCVVIRRTNMLRTEINWRCIKRHDAGFTGIRAQPRWTMKNIKCVSSEHGATKY